MDQSAFTPIRTSTAWRDIEYTYTVPPNGNLLRFDIQNQGGAANDGRLDITYPSVVLMADGNLIVEGSVFARHANIEDFYAKVVNSRKITTDQLMVGQGENHISNPNFEDNDGQTAYGWDLTSGNTIVKGGGMNGANALRVESGSGQSGSYFGASDPKLHGARVQEGDHFRFSVQVSRATLATVGVDRVRIFVRWYTESGTSWVSIDSISNEKNLPNAGSWQMVSGILQVPAGAAYAVMGLYRQQTVSTALLFSHPTMVRATDASMIVQGTLSVISTDEESGITIRPDGSAYSNGIIEFYGASQFGVAEASISLGTDAGLDTAKLMIQGPGSGEIILHDPFSPSDSGITIRSEQGVAVDGGLSVGEGLGVNGTTNLEGTLSVFGRTNLGEAATDVVTIAGTTITGVWSSYSPTLTATNTNPSGSLTRFGRYQRIGRSIFFSIMLTMGSTFNPGSGAYSITLPVSAATNRTQIAVGQIRIGTSEDMMFGKLEGGNTIERMWLASGLQVNHGRGWGNGDRIILSGTYEASTN